MASRKRPAAGGVANELLRRATLHASTRQLELLAGCATWTGATGDRVQICALLHSPQYNGKEGVIEGRPTGTAGPVRLYSCTTMTARGNILQIYILQ
eukprot:COSAG01_NODE_52997_length_341_cov_0.855967_1_plen_96_part_10